MPPERNRWLVLSFSLLVCVCIGGGYSWSVFISPLSHLYGWSHRDIAVAYSINMGIAPIPLCFGSILARRFGERMVIWIGGLVYCLGILAAGFATSLGALYLSYGVIAGMGSMAALSAVLANAVKGFPDRSGLALGLALAGFSSSAFLVAPVAVLLMGAWGVAWTLKVLGLGMLVLVGLSGLGIRNAPPSRDPREAGGGPPSALEKDWRQMLADPRFYLLLVLFSFGIFAGVLIISTAAAIAQGMFRFETTSAAMLVGLISVANGTGRIFSGGVSDRIGSKGALVGVFALTCLALAALLAFRSSLVFACAVLVIGFSYGACMVATAATIKSQFGAKHYASNYAVTFLAYTVVTFVAPRVAALIREAFHDDYTVAFWVSLAVAGMGLVVATGSLVWERLAAPGLTAVEHLESR